MWTEKVFDWWRENGVLEKVGGYEAAEQDKGEGKKKEKKEKKVDFRN